MFIIKINQIIKTIQNAKSSYQINQVLKQATIFEYVKTNLEIQYDYQIDSINPNQYVDLDHKPVDLLDLKNAVLSIIG